VFNTVGEIHTLLYPNPSHFTAEGRSVRQSVRQSVMASSP